MDTQVLRSLKIFPDENKCTYLPLYFPISVERIDLKVYLFGFGCYIIPVYYGYS